MGGAYKFTNDELRLILHELDPMTTKGQALCQKINDELTRRETVAKRSAGKGAVRKRDVSEAQLLQAAILIQAGGVPLRKVVAETGVPYGRVWQMSKRQKENQLARLAGKEGKEGLKEHGPGQTNQNRPK